MYTKSTDSQFLKIKLISNEIEHGSEQKVTDLKKKRLDRASIDQKVKPKKVSDSHLVGTTLRPYHTCLH